jgi:hypothetical protein
MKIPPEQKQHVISETYLEQFSFIHKSDGKQICILQRDSAKTTTRFIKSFNRYVNFFDIESDNIELQRAFEESSGKLETYYTQIIKQLENNKWLTEEYTSYLLQYATNLISRSKIWRERVRNILNSEDKLPFIKHILLHHIETEEEIKNLENNELLTLSDEKLINRVLFLFSDHLWFHLCVFEIIFLKAPETKGWFTSDNPVVISKAKESNNPFFKLFLSCSKLFKEPTRFLAKPETISENTEIYFPLTPKYLAFIYNPKLKTSTNKLRRFKPNSINEVSDEEFEQITKTIIDGSYEHIICPFYLEYDNPLARI